MELTKDEIGALIEWYMRNTSEWIRTAGVEHVRPESLERLVLFVRMLKEDASGTTP